MNGRDIEAAEEGRVDAEAGRVEAETERVDAEAGDGGAELEQGRVQAERDRVQAEEERQATELRRRIAEGGPDNNVPGEPPGTIGRVEAEEHRVAAARKIYVRVAALIALPLAVIALVPSLVGMAWLHREIDRRCEDAAENRASIRQTTIDGLPTIGFRYSPDTDSIVPNGAPTIEYYRAHDAERLDALERAQATLDRFPVIRC